MTELGSYCCRSTREDEDGNQNNDNGGLGEGSKRWYINSTFLALKGPLDEAREENEVKVFQLGHYLKWDLVEHF